MANDQIGDYDINIPQATRNEVPAFPHLSRIDLKHAAAVVNEPYRNFVVARVNNHCVRMAVMQGEYPWHQHPRSDEWFLTLEGCLEIDLVDGQTIILNPGEAFTVPAGTVHRTRSKVRSVNLCFEHLSAYTDVEFTDETSQQ
jgi:mannose-6-phosphate isomerase-like protein (cupin superfamily)